MARVLSLLYLREIDWKLIMYHFNRPVERDGRIANVHILSTVNHLIDEGVTDYTFFSYKDDASLDAPMWSTNIRVGLDISDSEQQAAIQTATESPEFEEYIDETETTIERLLTILTDEQAQEIIDAFPAWAVGVVYTVDYRVKYNNKLYKCVQAHTSQADWTPDIVPALWTPLQPEQGDDDPTTIPVWVQPTGAHDAYNTGDRVLYPDASGQVYESIINGNVWSPVDYPAGWKLIETPTSLD